MVEIRIKPMDETATVANKIVKCINSGEGVNIEVINNYIGYLAGLAISEACERLKESGIHVIAVLENFFTGDSKNEDTKKTVKWSIRIKH